jgi:CheY-like chemotaxis protein
MNLCTNACQAIGEASGRIVVQLDRRPLPAEISTLQPDMQPGDYICLRVIDDGCGMTPETRERIFDPFYTTKGVGSGTGLGLSVVHGIVATHGGRLTVETEVGVGSTFSVYLPLTERPVAVSHDANRSAVVGNGRILLVDDDDALLRTAGDMLAMLGYSVRTARNGDNALAIFRQDPDHFDAIVTDQAMPRMTGVELAHEIHSIRPRVPVILVTGFSDQVTEYNAANHGLSGYLSKPYRAADLSNALQVVLGLGSHVEV